jgi:hypothetical protein
MMGKVKDEVTGTTTVTPYFVFEPAQIPNIQNYHIYDSVTLIIRPTGITWGDTTQIETFHIHRLTELPELKEKEDYLKYNTQNTPYDPAEWATISFYPIKQRFRNLYFKLDDKIGNEFFDLLKARSEDITRTANFIKYFNGLVFIPDEDNHCLIKLSTLPTDLRINIHYHDASTNYVYSISNASIYTQFSYMNIVNEPVGTPYEAIQHQTTGLLFQNAVRGDAPYGQTVAQGMSGFFTKMQLPIQPSGSKYQTIVKAEIVMKMQKNVNNNNFGELTKISVYRSDVLNRLISPLSVNSINVEGRLVRDNIDPEKDAYVINITDYYDLLTKSANASQINHIVIGPSSVDLLRSFNRMTIDEVPILRVYYATYE